jgi:hypothetical protein
MADVPQIIGTRERLGAEPFVLDPVVPATAYRRRASGKRRPFEVVFQVAEEYPNRRFYLMELLRALARCEPSHEGTLGCQRRHPAEPHRPRPEPGDGPAWAEFAALYVPLIRRAPAEEPRPTKS